MSEFDTYTLYDIRWWATVVFTVCLGIAIAWYFLSEETLVAEALQVYISGVMNKFAILAGVAAVAFVVERAMLTLEVFMQDDFIGGCVATAVKKQNQRGL